LLGQSIASLLLISFLITAVVVIFRTAQVGNQLVTNAMREIALHTSERNNTKIDLLPPVTDDFVLPDSGCTISFWVKNTGTSEISRFDQISLLMYFNGSPDLIGLDYMESGDLGLNKWNKNLPEELDDSTANDLYHTGVLDSGEVMLLEARVDGVGKGSGTVVVVTSNGVAANISFQPPSTSADYATSTPIAFGERISASLDAVGEIDIYFFEGKQGQSITVALETPMSNLDTWLEILTPSQSDIWDTLVKLAPPVMLNDDSEGTDSRIGGYILPETGVYVLRALSYYTPVSYNPSDPKAFGSYDITLELLSDTFALTGRNLTIHCK
jgi:archaellum component FlaG (FlaF/FlaG flagellin family)